MLNIFKDCTSLTSVTIPNSVTSISDNPFWGCDKLERIIVDKSNPCFDDGDGGNAIIQKKGNKLISGCKNTRIPPTVEIIGRYAFAGTAIAHIDIKDSVKTIEQGAFLRCKELESAIISEKVEIIPNSAFLGCSSLSYVYIGGNAYVDPDAFRECNLKLIVLGEGIETRIKDNKYWGYFRLTDSNISKNITIAFVNNVIMDIRTNNDYSLHFVMPKTPSSNKLTYPKTAKEVSFSTFSKAPVYLKPNISSTSCRWDICPLDRQHDYGLVTVGDTIIYGLEPNGRRDLTILLSDGNEYKTSVLLDELYINTQQPKVISAGNVIVAAESNINDGEKNVGFEWRRTDWTDEFPSNEGNAYLYAGTMEGYIRNLYTEKLWKYRPYYESASGKRYYGEWVGIDPTNTSYFEPTVHTYSSVTVNGTTASVRGYTMRGTDAISTSGFKYWPEKAAARSYSEQSIPNSAKTVEVKGTVIEAELTELDYDTDYCYVAFVTTSEGESFYGDIRHFTTAPDLTGINTTATFKKDIPVGYYDLRGRRYQQPQKGLNIVVLPDGTTKKVVVK